MRSTTKNGKKWSVSNFQGRTEMVNCVKLSGTEVVTFYIFPRRGKDIISKWKKVQYLPKYLFHWRMKFYQEEVNMIVISVLPLHLLFPLEMLLDDPSFLLFPHHHFIPHFVRAYSLAMEGPIKGVSHFLFHFHIINICILQF